MADLNYRLSPPAEMDLREIFDYTEDNSGRIQAIQYLRSFEDIFRLISDNPDIGRNRNEIRKGLKSLAHKKHVVFYRILKSHIRIIRVLHGNRDLPNQF